MDTNLIYKGTFKNAFKIYHNKVTKSWVVVSVDKNHILGWYSTKKQALDFCERKIIFV